MPAEMGGTGLTHHPLIGADPGTGGHERFRVPVQPLLAILAGVRNGSQSTCAGTAALKELEAAGARGGGINGPLRYNSAGHCP
jgi:hypothetical protein